MLSVLPDVIIIYLINLHEVMASIHVHGKYNISHRASHTI